MVRCGAVRCGVVCVRCVVCVFCVLFLVLSLCVCFVVVVGVGVVVRVCRRLCGVVACLLLNGGLSSLQSWLCQCCRRCDGCCMVYKNEISRRCEICNHFLSRWCYRSFCLMRCGSTSSGGAGEEPICCGGCLAQSEAASGWRLKHLAAVATMQVMLEPRLDGLPEPCNEPTSRENCVRKRPLQ